MNRAKPKVGQIVFSLNIGNAARRCEQCLTPYTVTKVGRKYFYASKDGRAGWGDVKFHVDTWHEATQYCADHKLYETAKEYNDDKETDLICNEIRRAFEYGRNKQGISLAGLRKIRDIITSGAL